MEDKVISAWEGVTEYCPDLKRSFEILFWTRIGIERHGENLLFHLFLPRLYYDWVGLQGESDFAESSAFP